MLILTLSSCISCLRRLITKFGSTSSFNITYHPKTKQFFFRSSRPFLSQQDIENSSMGFSILITSLDTMATLWAKRHVDIVSSNWS